jgi:hypothetical protein
MDRGHLAAFKHHVGEESLVAAGERAGDEG